MTEQWEAWVLHWSCFNFVTNCLQCKFLWKMGMWNKFDNYKAILLTTRLWNKAIASFANYVWVVGHVQRGMYLPLVGRLLFSQKYLDLGALKWVLQTKSQSYPLNFHFVPSLLNKLQIAYTSYSKIASILLFPCFLFKLALIQMPWSKVPN